VLSAVAVAVVGVVVGLGRLGVVVREDLLDLVPMEKSLLLLGVALLCIQGESRFAMLLLQKRKVFLYYFLSRGNWLRYGTRKQGDLKGIVVANSEEEEPYLLKMYVLRSLADLFLYPCTLPAAPVSRSFSL